MRRLISLMRCFSKKSTPKKPDFQNFSKIFKHYCKKYYNFRTENAAPPKHQFIPQFFSAVKKDYFQKSKNGHF